jgi:hypothetical protein
MRTFWLLNSSVVRILAEMDMRQLTVASAAQSDEGARQVRERLVLEVGSPIKFDETEPDTEGVGWLKTVQFA